MSESGFASLGPSLLARKGGAKPAMRPQVAPLAAPVAGGDDLPGDAGQCPWLPILARTSSEPAGAH